MTIPKIPPLKEVRLFVLGFLYAIALGAVFYYLLSFKPVSSLVAVAVTYMVRRLELMEEECDL